MGYDLIGNLTHIPGRTETSATLVVAGALLLVTKKLIETMYLTHIPGRTTLCFPRLFRCRNNQTLELRRGVGLMFRQKIHKTRMHVP